MTKSKKKERQQKHDNHNDPSGRVLFRTWLYSSDRDNKDLRHSSDDLGPMVVRVKETRSYTPRVDLASEARAEKADRERRYQEALASLTPLERDVLRHQGKLKHRQEVRIVIAAGDLVEYQRNGYTLIPGSSRDVERSGLSPVTCVEVYGYEDIQVEPIDYHEIARLLEISVYQVHRAVKGANKKMGTKRG
jgi:DNA-binding CsgD family transcriptional regulator